MTTTTSVTRPPRPLGPRLFAWGSLVVILALVAWAWLGIEIVWEKLAGAPGDAWRLAQAMFGHLAWGEFGGLIGDIGVSLSIAWLGTVFAAVIGVPLAFLAAENLVSRPVAFGMRQVFNVIRAVPEIVLAIVLIPIFGLTYTTGVVTLGIHSIGTIGRLCAEVIEDIDRGPVEAAEAVGATRLERLRWAVLPQSLPEIASFVMYRFEINIRASAVLGILGIGGIGTTLLQSLRFREYGTAGLALLLTVAVTVAIDWLSGKVRRRLVLGPQHRGRVTPSEAAALTTPVPEVPAPVLAPAADAPEPG